MYPLKIKRAMTIKSMHVFCIYISMKFFKIPQMHEFKIFVCTKIILSISSSTNFLEYSHIYICMCGRRDAERERKKKTERERA